MKNFLCLFFYFITVVCQAQTIDFSKKKDPIDGSITIQSTSVRLDPAVSKYPTMSFTLTRIDTLTVLSVLTSFQANNPPEINIGDELIFKFTNDSILRLFFIDRNSPTCFLANRYATIWSLQSSVLLNESDMAKIRAQDITVIRIAAESHITKIIKRRFQPRLKELINMYDYYLQTNSNH